MQNIVIKALTKALDYFSKMFFWLMVGLSGWWFVFFKLQERVFYLLPELGNVKYNYKPYNAMLASVLAAKCLSILYKIIFE